MKISYDAAQNNFDKYLKIASDLEDVIVTRNRKELAKITSVEGRPEVREEALNYYFNREGKVTYQEFLELTKNSDLRYEFIDGEVYCLASPVYNHQVAVREINGTFYNWFKGKKCQPFTSPFDVTLVKGKDNINVVQPDILVMCDSDKVDKKGKYHGIPTLVVEVLSDSTKKRDLQKKMDLYKETGIKEYWLVDPKKKKIAIYTLEGGDFKEIKYTGNTAAKSIIFAGLEVSLSKVFPE